MRLIFSFLSLLFLLTLFLFPKPAFALNSTVSYDVTYDVLENGVTKVLFDIQIKNQDDYHYVSSYTIKTGFDDVENVRIYNSEGNITSETKKTQDGYEIIIDFNNRVVGAGNIQSFKINFETKNISNHQGSIWEINIPGIASQNDFENFNVHINVPFSFGQASYTKPIQPTQDLNFSKEQLGKSGISIVFGKKQIYKFSLYYHLENKNIYPVSTEIALPPSTNYQDIILENINPKPQNVILDSDGNWLAQYKLNSSSRLNVRVDGKAEVFPYPKKEALTNDERETYLKEQPFWEFSPEIKKLAKTLKTPYAIYEYVSKTLKYDYSRVTTKKPRLGAAKVLENPTSAVCLEFTDLFVALARASGVPAREVDGFAYTQNQKQRPLSTEEDILHSWPEFYDNELGTWIMIDPTWASTTKGVDYFSFLDYDHLTFVIKGKDSVYPVPAGGYKTEKGGGKKDVFVDFIDSIGEVSPKIEISPEIPNEIPAGLPISGKVIIRNTGSTFFPSQILLIESDFLNPKSVKTKLTGIPPFGYIKVPISFGKTSFLTNQSVNIKIVLGKNPYEYFVKISPLIYTKVGLITGGVLFGIIIGLVIYITRKSRSVPFSKQEG